MLIVIGFGLLVALIAWFYWVTNPRPGAAMGTSSAAAPVLPAGLSVAFISAGKLFCKSGNGALTQLFSPYIQDIEDRLARSKEPSPRSTSRAIISAN